MTTVIRDLVTVRIVVLRGCTRPGAAGEEKSATVTVLDDRIEMADSSGELTLDMMFEWVETMPVPEGYKVEIVGGNIFVTPPPTEAGGFSLCRVGVATDQPGP